MWGSAKFEIIESGIYSKNKSYPKENPLDLKSVQGFDKYGKQLPDPFRDIFLLREFMGFFVDACW